MNLSRPARSTTVARESYQNGYSQRAEVAAHDASGYRAGVDSASVLRTFDMASVGECCQQLFVSRRTLRFTVGVSACTGTSFRGRMPTTAPHAMASLGMPKTTQLASS